MKLKHITSVPAAESDLLNAVFVSNANVGGISAHLSLAFGVKMDVTEAAAEKGFQTLHFSGKTRLVLIGIGDPADEHEGLRRAVHTAVSLANDHKLERLLLSYPRKADAPGEVVTALAESAALSNYQFLNYKTVKEENSLKETFVLSANSSDKQLVGKGAKIAEATMAARDLINEPVITLTAKELANRAEKYGKKYGFSVEVFNEKKIRSLKMGGLLAVNSGSIDPPTFSILEWKPKKARNKKPYILVGKGVVYDTGGLSLKPTANSMDFMKADMGGAAAVVGTMIAVSALELDVHVIGLVPATDNRPGQNAYTPGDVIKMYDGSTVEVLNTDAEGRMILADALAYAKKYDPELVIDLATLTGAAVIAVGTQGIAMMSTAGQKVRDGLKTAGDRVYERLVELPLWEEYKELLKSDIADLKNIGGRTAGSITAGKFVVVFTDYPWVHLDIAGPTFLHSADSYRGKNGTGTGVRLLTEFLSKV